MTTTTTARDVRAAFTRATAAAASCGIDTSTWHLQTGSPTNGQAWRIFDRDPATGGMGRIPGTSDGYGWIGNTRREAHTFLAGMVAAFDAAMHVNGMRDPATGPTAAQVWEAWRNGPDGR